MTSAQFVLAQSSLIAAIGSIQTSAEMLYEADVLRDDGLLSWHVSSLRARWLVAPPLKHVLDWLFSFPHVAYLYGLRLASAALLVATSTVWQSPGIYTLSLLTLSLTYIVMPLRCPFGRDGAEQMTTLISVSIALTTIFPGGISRTSGVLFIAAQACLAYMSAGIAKIVVPSWWNGEHLTRVMQTRAFGFRPLGDLLARRAGVASNMAKAVILFEILFPMVLVLPRAGAIALLAAGVVFHIGNALIMGLNNFVWAFAATYPAVLYTNQLIHERF